MNITNSDGAQDLIKDCVQLARIEGLEGHAQAAECRLTKKSSTGGEDDSRAAKRSKE